MVTSILLVTLRLSLNRILKMQLPYFWKKETKKTFSFHWNKIKETLRALKAYQAGLEYFHYLLIQKEKKRWENFLAKKYELGQQHQKRRPPNINNSLSGKLVLQSFYSKTNIKIPKILILFLKVTPSVLYVILYCTHLALQCVKLNTG